MLEASSPYERAENRHVTPARANDRTIDGPASPIASPMMTKMPVPMIAPMPRAVRSRTPTARWRPSSPLVSRARYSTGLRANGPGGDAVAIDISSSAAGWCNPFARTRRGLNEETAAHRPCTVPSARTATFKGRARVSPGSDLHARRGPAAGHRRRRRGDPRWGPDGDPARRDRHRQDDDDGGHHRARPAPDARHGAQQDARRAALQRVPH